MKALRTAALIVGAVALVATGIGAAASIGAFGTLAAGTMSAATAAALGTISTIATVASVAAGALSLAAGLLTKKPSQTGSPTEFDASADGAIPYAMGRTATAGKIVYWKEHGSPSKTPNDRQTFVVVLSGAGPIQEHERFDADQATVTFDGSYNAVGFYHGYMWMKTQLGLTPSPHLNYISGVGTPAPGWTPQHLLSGYAAAMWTLVFDSKKGKYYQNGTAKPMWVMKGVKVYDPRQDSTFPGGSGPCRAGDETTYVWAGVDADHPAGENPFLQALTWVIGRFQNGKRILGIGALLIAIDVPAFAEGANVCDANGWKVGGMAYSTDNKWDTLVNILQAGAGEPLALGAKISCMVNSPKVSLDTIRVGDLSGAVSVTATKSRRDRINTITPRVRLEDQFWEPVALAPITATEYLGIDGGQRSKEIAYTFCQNTEQAAQLARYDIENAREFEPITLPLRPRWMGYKPGDCLTAILPEVGLNGHKIMLTQRTLDPGSGLPVMTARSETDAKHAYALGQTTVAPPTPSVAVRVPVPAPDDAAWAITAGAIEAEGTVQPALVIEGANDDPNADGIVFEYRPVVTGAGADDNWLAAGVEPATTVRKVIPGVASGTSFEVGVSYREGGRFGDRLILGPVTAGSLSTGDNTSSAIATSFPVGLAITAADDGTITINDHVRRYIDGHADVSVTGASIASGLAPGDFRAIGYDDLGRVGGAVTYGLYADDLDARVSPANPGRHYVGYGFIPTAGSPPAPGGGGSPPGGNCVTVDTPILMDDGSTKSAGDIVVGDRLWTRHEVSLGWGFYPVEAIEIVDSDDVWQATIGGRTLRATGAHLVYVGQWVAMRDLPGAVLQEVADRVVKMTVTGAHTYVSNGVLSHNIKSNNPTDIP